MTPAIDSTVPEKRSSPVLVAVAWIIVGIPAAWGVTQTINKSMALFQAPSAPAAPAVAK